MQLNLKTKTVRFEMVDDESETTITLSSEDDQETICRKLRKVLSLAEQGEPTEDELRIVRFDSSPNGAGLDVARAAEARLERDGKLMKTTTVGQPANGWKKYEAPQIPDRLKDEVELIEEGE